MIYLDTSAFIKLYLREEGSEDVQSLVTGQDDPLPVWDFLEAELTNALWLKVFWGELDRDAAAAQVERFEKRKERGFYFRPDLERAALMATFRDLAMRTPESGCRWASTNRMKRMITAYQKVSSACVPWTASNASPCERARRDAPIWSPRVRRALEVDPAAASASRARR